MEHIAREVVLPEFEPSDPQYKSIGDVDGFFASQYKSFKNKVIAARDSFNSFVATVRPARTLAFTLGAGDSKWDKLLENETPVLYYTLMSQSPYIDTSQGNDDLNGNGKSDALEYKEKLIERNKKAVNALLSYCKEIRHVVRLIRLIDPKLRVIDDAFLDNMDKASYFAYNVSTKVRAFELKLAVKRYERNKKYYNAFVSYYDTCYAAWRGNHASDAHCELLINIFLPGFTYSFDYSILQDTTSFREGWNKYRVTGNDHKTYVWSWLEGDWQLLPSLGGDIGHWFAPWHDGRTLPEYAELVNHNGGYYVSAITRSLQEKIDNIYAGAPPPALVEKMISSARTYYRNLNSSHKDLFAARQELVASLNKVNDEFKDFFPRAQGVDAEPKSPSIPLPWPDLSNGPFSSWSAPTAYYYSFSPSINLCGNRGDNPKVNAGTYNQIEVVKNSKFRLTATATDFPSECGPLSYRWILMGIPHTPNARSQRYVKYQVLSTTNTAELEPDLDGTWVVQLEVNNNRQLAMASTNLQAKRIILSLKHHDGQITLESQDDTYKNQPYYLEVANDEITFFRNFDDDDCPVDPSDYNPPWLQESFSIQRSPAYTPPAETGGLYDGTEGSINLITPKIIHGSPLPLRLCSSAWSGMDVEDAPPGFDLRLHRVPILVKTLDDKITHLSLIWYELIGTSSQTYDNLFWKNKLKFERDNATHRCQGEYKISQWVDLKHWDNPGCVLLPIPLQDPTWTVGLQGFSGGKNNIPDWMERKAAEAINTVGEIFPYVREIRIVRSGPYGKTYPPHPDIYLNAFSPTMRHNGADNAYYGFVTIGAGLNESTARHEAFHIYRFADWHPGTGSDGDWDRLLFKGGPGTLYQYLWDSPFNLAGPYGPRYTDNKKIAFAFLGDNQRDDSFGKIKRNFTSLSIPLFWIQIFEPGQLPPYQTVDLDPRLVHFPMRRFIIKQAFVLGRDDRVTPARIKKWPLARGITYEHTGDRIMVTDPNLRGMHPGLFSYNGKVSFHLLLLDVYLWQQIYNQMLREGYSPDQEIYFEYEVESAQPVEEWDAALCQPAQHTGFHFHIR